MSRQPRVCVVNLPWEIAERHGIRAGCRFPNVTPKNTNRYMPFPFLVAYTAAYLEQQGATVLAIDGCAERCDIESFLTQIMIFRPDLVIAETSTTSLAYDLDLLTHLRDKCADVNIAIYGSHTDARPEDGLIDTVVDYVIQGEPELTAHALTQVISGNLEPDDVLGLAWLAEDGSVHANQRRPVIKDIDTLPYPKRDGLPMDTYNVTGFPSPVAFVYAGRGCPHQCTFCLWPQTTLKGAFRPRSPEKIVEEMAWILERYPNTKSFFFDDDTFNISRERMMRFADEMDRRGIRIPWGCNARADNWDRDVLERLVQTGLFTLRMGIESGDQDILDRMKKKLDLTEARTNLELMHELGIENHIMFVVGLPGETKETVDRTIDFIKSVPSHSVQFSAAVPFPGTAYYAEAEEKGHLLTHDWSQYSGFDHVVARTDAMSADEIGAALVHARRRIYFSPQFIWRRLQYIRHPKDVVALSRKALRLFTRTAFDRVSPQNEQL